MTFDELANMTASSSDSNEKKILLILVKRVDKELGRADDKTFEKAIRDMNKKGVMSDKEYEEIKIWNKAYRSMRRVIEEAILKVEEQSLFSEMEGDEE